MKLELCRALSCAGVSLTVSMALPCQSRVDVSDDSYGCVAPKLYRTIAMAVSRQSCTDVLDDSYGCVAPKLYGCVGR